MFAAAEAGIRFARIGDAAPIATLHADNWRRHYRGAYSDRYLDDDLDADRLALWTGRLRQPDTGRITLVAADEARLVGFVHLVLDADPTWGTLVDNLHVVRSLQQGGIGTRLLSAAAPIVVDRRPGSGIYLWVLEQNEPAQAFYLSRKGDRGDREMVTPPRGDPRNLNGTPAKLRMSWPDPTTLIRRP
ncbi:MAG: GNAT family N-acetyltransferase [Acidimicrobiales bacterium]